MIVLFIAIQVVLTYHKIMYLLNESVRVTCVL